MIRGNISHQKLDLASCKVVSDSIDYLTAEFTFSPDWYGAVKVAHFSNGSDTYDIILTDDRIRPEDHLNLSAGNWNVYLHGNIGDTRITTDAQLLRVHRTGMLNGEPLPEIPLSAAEQILHKAANAEELAQSVVDRADAGEFIGPPGPEGPPGKVDEGTISKAVEDYLDEHPIEAPVQSVNGQTGDVVVPVPTKVSQLQNDAGYLTQHQDISGKQDKINDLATIRAGAAKGATALQSESDPTVPAWAKQPSKPSYTAAEVRALPDTTPIPEEYDDTEVRQMIADKYSRPAGGIPESDLSAAVRQKLNSGGGGGGSSFQFVPENLITADRVGTMVINGSTVTGLSNWIPVKKGEHFTCDAKNRQYYWFDADKNYVSSSTQVADTVRITAEQDGYLLIKVNSEDKRCVRGSYFEYNVGIVSRWNGRKWLAIGDSITDIAVADKGYPYIVGSNLGMEVTNVGNSGKVMAYFHDKIDGYADDYDLITVMLGTNNQGYNSSIGAINDSYYQSGDYGSNNSFCAQTQHLIDLLLAKYPSSQILFLTPIRRTADGGTSNEYKKNALGLTTAAYAKAVQDVCAYYGIDCIDLYTAGIMPQIQVIRENYFINGGDGTHPNNDGHARFTAPKISEYLLSMAPFGERIQPVPPTPPEPETYTVTNNLTNCTNSNSAATITEGDSYTATITAVDGYELKSVSYTMGGQTVSVSDGVISIASVSGDIIITASAEAIPTPPVPGGYTLMHSYQPVVEEDGTVIKDTVGTWNLASYNSTKLGTNTVSDLTITDDVTLYVKGWKRQTNYFSQNTIIRNGPAQGMHIGAVGSDGNTGRIRIRYASTGTAVYGDGHILLDVLMPGNNNPTTRISDDTVIKNGESADVAVMINAATHTAKLYVNGNYSGETTYEALPRFDALTVEQANNIGTVTLWEKLEIYKGIVPIEDLT